MKVSLVDLIQSFRSSVLQKLRAYLNNVWDVGLFQSFRKDCHYGPKGVHQILRQTVSGSSERDIHYQMFCEIMIDPSFPITSFKIVSAVRKEVAERLGIDSF